MLLMYIIKKLKIINCSYGIAAAHYKGTDFVLIQIEKVGAFVKEKFKLPRS